MIEPCNMRFILIMLWHSTKCHSQGVIVHIACWETQLYGIQALCQRLGPEAVASRDRRQQRWQQPGAAAAVAIFTVHAAASHPRPEVGRSTCFALNHVANVANRWKPQGRLEAQERACPSMPGGLLLAFNSISWLRPANLVLGLQRV